MATAAEKDSADLCTEARRPADIVKALHSDLRDEIQIKGEPVCDQSHIAVANSLYCRSRL